MRIIAGTFRGRRLTVPKTLVRPTADRVREAWMSILGPALAEARVLDLWAGSGALGLEALSRGAASATFVDRDRQACDAIAANIEALGIGDRAVVRRTDAWRFAERLGPGAYDVVLADPPYDSDLAARLTTLFRTRPFSRILAVEHATTLGSLGDETRRYGSTAISFCYAP